MTISTLTEPNTTDPPYTDEVIRLRRWGEPEDPIVLPPKRDAEYVIGTDPSCDIRVTGQHVSKRHARLLRDHHGWRIYDAESKNGLYVDQERCAWAPVRPGTEIGLGQRFILVAESTRTIALRAFLERLLGWSAERAPAVDLALRSLVAIKPGRAFAIVSKSDPVAIAYSMHRLTVGGRWPFITADPSRTTTSETVRTTENYADGMEALVHATGGTLCVVASRLPHDFDEVRAELSKPTATTQLAVCSHKPIDSKKFLTAPIIIPSLSERGDELRRVILEYAMDAIGELEGRREQLPRGEDLDAVYEHDSGSLSAIEAATLRFAAFRKFGNATQTARRLGMTRQSLEAWLGRRSTTTGSR